MWERELARHLRPLRTCTSAHGFGRNTAHTPFTSDLARGGPKRRRAFSGCHSPYGAIRAGDWKLIEFYEDMHVELYNLKGDIGEKDDLTQRLPEKVKELRGRLHAWRKAVGAQMPTPNPNYRP